MSGPATRIRVLKSSPNPLLIILFNTNHLIFETITHQVYLLSPFLGAIHLKILISSLFTKFCDTFPPGYRGAPGHFPFERLGTSFEISSAILEHITVVAMTATIKYAKLFNTVK